MIRKAAVIVLLLTAAFLPAAELPKSIVMESGDVRVRLDAKKRWNINRIEWKRQLVCIDSPEAHYGTTCRPAGSPHFIGSGHAESGAGEEVESVKIFSDGKEVVPGTGVITGKSVGMEKRSKIHDFRVKYTFEIEDGVMTGGVVGYYFEIGSGGTANNVSFTYNGSMHISSGVK